MRQQAVGELVEGGDATTRNIPQRQLVSLRANQQMRFSRSSASASPGPRAGPPRYRVCDALQQFTPPSADRMSESIPVHWLLLVALWVYDLTNAVVAALPPSVNTGWTTSPLMGYVYNVIATVVRSSVWHGSSHLECWLTLHAPLPAVSDAFYIRRRCRIAPRRLAVVCSSRLHARNAAPLLLDGRCVGAAAVLPPPVAHQGPAHARHPRAARALHPTRRQLRVAVQLRVGRHLGLHDILVLWLGARR